ncbi:hypothetical protein [Bordetella bronchialis]|uniref:Translation initiation factor IF-2 n=1 Tax=Bordetella bronchialis TaxID=463025 RepID=A0ABN4R0A0_9BORD|nr:hypothetical protein [Bordetella bronchialis]ANN65844.1 hypothetical protein BAU06_05630 [Bordetella bronchialis]
MKRNRKHPLVALLLYIAAAIALAIAPWAVSGVQAADQRSSSGSSRPLMPGNQPAGTGLDQPVPGSKSGPPSSLGPNARQPATSAPAPGAVPPPTSVAPPSPGQGTVQGSKGAPGSIGDPAGGTAGTRGNKDNRRGH